MTQRDILDREITGEISITLGDKTYPIGFPIYAVAVYKQETAKLNCRRAREAAEAGRPRLTADETREMRKAYRKAVAELEGKDAAEFTAIMEEIIEMRARLDEEAGTGDSLFQLVNWWKIHEADPERVLLALWSGLHQEEGDTWRPPLSIAQLRKLVDARNIGYVLTTITKALSAYMPRVEKKKEESTLVEELRRIEAAPDPLEMAPATE